MRNFLELVPFANIFADRVDRFTPKASFVG